jgi:TonB-linked SusC/RagA family outer membrane protein
MKRSLLLSIPLLFFLAGIGFSQERTISGTVTAADNGSAIPGVNVILKGTTQGTVTDVDGKYKLEVPASGGTLVFSFIGLTTQEVEIGQRSVIDMAMQSETTELNEVVVTALGIQREERSLGYAVQKVDGDKINDVKTDNFLNSLNGRVAGLYIKNNTNFGGSDNVVVRGASSLTQNNQALFVVDGVPISNANTNNSGQLAGRSGYDFGNAAADINPNDIESISVLKGAAATALYGSRAANGVILITTKKGKKGHGLGVTLNSNTAFGNIDKSTFPEYQQEYGGGYGPYYSANPNYPYLYDFDVNGDGVSDPVVPTTEDASRGQRFDPNFLVWQYDAFWPKSKNFGKPTPWVAAANGPSTFFETQVNQTNSIDVSNATDNGSYRFSYTNQDFSGVMPNSKLKKNNFIFNGTYNILKNLKISTSANYIKTNAKGRPSTGYSDNILSSFRQWYEVNVDIKEQEQLYQMYAKDGINPTWNIHSPTELYPEFWDNPYWVRFKNYETDGRSRLIGYAQADWQITDYLSAMGRMGIDTYTQLQEERKAVGSVAGELGVDRPDVTSGYSRYDRTFTETNADFILKFNKRFGNIDLGALLGSNIRRSRTESVFASTNNGLAVPDLYALSNSADPMLPPQESLLQLGVNGIFGDVNVGFNDMVYLEATLRRDQSSTLPAKNNSYVYPSVSGTFLFSELMNASWLSLGKLRLNFAEVGNSAPPLSVLDTYRGVAPFNGVTLATNYISKNNPDLKPERQQTQEGGLTMDFLNNRVGFDLAVYKSSTFDQLMPVSVSRATGYSSKWVNAGQIDNKGVELSLHATPVKTGNFSWDLGLNWSRNRNEVVKLFTDAAGNEVTNLVLSGNLQGGVLVVARKGEPYGAIIGSDYEYLNGQPIVKSNGRYQISSTNDNVIGNYNPDWIGGLSNTFTYKDFSLSFLLSMQHGGDVFSLDMWYGTGTGLYKETAGLNELGNPKRDPVLDNGGGSYDPKSGGIINPGVLADGTPNTKRIAADSYAVDGWAVSPNSRFVYDASYLKLREVTLTYNLPGSLIKSTPLYGASVSLVGSNLWIIHKNLPYADPEATQSSGNVQGWQSGVMPTVRTYGFNIRVQF